MKLGHEHIGLPDELVKLTRNNNQDQTQTPSPPCLSASDLLTTASVGARPGGGGGGGGGGVFCTAMKEVDAGRDDNEEEKRESFGRNFP